MAQHVLDEAQRCLNCRCPNVKGMPHSYRHSGSDPALIERTSGRGRLKLFENNPLTTVCSLVCNHEKQCEGHCVLGKREPLFIFSTIENYISSTYSSKMVKGPAPSNGIRVAIIGPCRVDHCRDSGSKGISGHHL